MAKEKDKPVLQIRRDTLTGKLAYRLPVKGAKWRNGFDNMDQLCQAAMKDLTPPWINDFVLDE